MPSFAETPLIYSYASVVADVAETRALLGEIKQQQSGLAFHFIGAGRWSK
jgi:hypothetical protein